MYDEKSEDFMESVLNFYVDPGGQAPVSTLGSKRLSSVSKRLSSVSHLTSPSVIFFKVNILEHLLS